MVRAFGFSARILFDQPPTSTAAIPALVTTRPHHTAAPKVTTINREPLR
jgi:hypothetical protein